MLQLHLERGNQGQLWASGCNESSNENLEDEDQRGSRKLGSNRIFDCRFGDYVPLYHYVEVSEGGCSDDRYQAIGKVCLADELNVGVFLQCR